MSTSAQQPSDAGDGGEGRPDSEATVVRNVHAAVAPEAVEEPPTVAEELPPAVEEPPAVVEEPPAVIEEPPAVIEEPPAIVAELPRAVEAPPRTFVEPDREGPTFSPAAATPAATALGQDHPEALVGAAFAGGLVLAMIFKRLGSRA